MDATLDAQRIEFASIILGQPLDSTQSLIYAQSETRIRQHAMRASFREKRSSLSGGQASTRPVLQPQSMLTGKFRSKPPINKRKPKNKRKAKQPLFISEDRDDIGEERVASPTMEAFISPALDASKSDPFHTLPIQMGPSQEHLLKLIHITSYMQSPLVLNPESSYLSYAFADAALLHAFFSLAGLYHDLSVGTKITPLSLMHRGETLRLVNERIAQTPLQLSDGTIGAVAALVIFDLLDGRPQSARWNLRGLQQMVVQRGGLRILGREARDFCGSWLLQRAICWSDLCSATVTNEKPWFPVMHFSSPLSRSGSQDSSLFSLLDSILDTLSELSVVLCHSHISPSRRLFFSNNIYLVEHALHSLPQDIYSSYYEPRRIAAIIYIYLFLRNIPRFVGIYQTLLGRLRNSVDQCINRNSEDFSSHHSNLVLLWICFIGAASFKTPIKMESDREWWIGLLQNICRRLHVASDTDFEDCLNRVVEMGSLCKGISHTIWREVQSSDPIMENMGQTGWMEIVYPI